MAQATVYMPDGKPFAFWDDTTRYTRIYYVAREHPRATDVGPTARASAAADSGKTRSDNQSDCWQGARAYPRRRRSAASAGWAALYPF